MGILVNFEPMYPVFESRTAHEYFIYFIFFSLLLQCKFANSTLLSLLRFTYFITPYDAQASSALSALITKGLTLKLKVAPTGANSFL